MKFTSIISAALCLAPVSLAAPVVEERQTTPASAVSASVAILQTSFQQNQDAITGAINNAKNNVNAAASVAASVSANLGAIAKGFQDAAAAVIASFQASGAGLQGQGQALAQAQIDNLAADLATLQQIVNGVGAVITFQATNLGPTARATVSAEVTAVKNAVAPFVNPVMFFADAASKASAQVTAQVYGLQGAYQGLQTVVNRFAATMGAPGFAFPGYAVTQ